MLTSIMIPFLLASVTEEEVYQLSDPVYTYIVRIDTLFINKSTGMQDNLEGNAGLSFKLRCRSSSASKQKCHIPEKSISYSPSTDPVHMVDNNNFTSSSLAYSQIRFIITFNLNAAINCTIERTNVADKSTLLGMYQMIGDQLNIGTDITSKGEKFDALENSVVGMCQTHYEIIRDPNFNRNDYKLRSLLEDNAFKLKKNETIRISKHRDLNDCISPRNYILGKILWTDLILASNFTVKPLESRSLMSMTRHDFHTKSINTFDLYDKEDKIIGFVHETIEIRLISVET